MKAEIENKLLAVIRVRGRVGVRHDIAETLSRLNLKYVNNMAILFGTKSNIGMIKKCNDFITYGEINREILPHGIPALLVLVYGAVAYIEVKALDHPGAHVWI